MNKSKFAAVLLVALCLCSLQMVMAQVEDKRVANVSSTGAAVRFEVLSSYAEATLTVAAPDGQVFRKQISAGELPEFKAIGNKGERLGDGVYTYELRLTPVLQAGVKEALAAARSRGDSDVVQRDLRKRGVLPVENLVQSGSFMIMNGAVIVAGSLEEEMSQPKSVAVDQPRRQSVNSNFKTLGMKRNHATLFFDQVIPDDLIVQGSACVGLDCVINENFGFDSIRVKENNTRIQFDDTSSSAGFAANNWQIRANNSASGGASFLAFVDQGATGNSETGTIVFEVDAGAPANSIKVGSNGKVGFRTATPVLDLHVNTSDTPAIRLEQNNAGGFTAQTWDIAGNEANFFVRDVTGGSRLPFRIRPGAPTSSIDISAAGNVGIGLAAPIHKLDVAGNMTIGTTFNSSVTVPLNGLLVEGNVGIGTQTPDQLLTVNGGASKPGGGSWSVFSDERLKKIKGNFNSGLSAVMQLQPLRYEYRRNNAMSINMEGEQIGFSAQAVQKVIPQAVIENAQGYLLVNNDPIIWTMLNAIKEQQAEIEVLKKEVNRLKRPTPRRRK
jgi:hypothetical protein